MQGQTLPEGAWVAPATGASKALPGDSPGGSRPGSLLVIQQQEDVKKSIYRHTQSFRLPLLFSLEVHSVRSPRELVGSGLVSTSLSRNGPLVKGTWGSP